MDKELSTRLYILTVAVAGVTFGVVAMLVWPLTSTTSDLWLMGLLVSMVVFAGYNSILLSRQAEASLFTVPVYIAVLLFHPTEAALIGAVGTLIFQIMLRRPARAVAFNTGMMALAGALGGIVYFALRPEGASLALTQEHIIAAALAGLVLHMHNILPLVGMITIRKGREFWLFWAESYTIEAVVEGMLLSLGLITALLVVQTPWGIALMIAPAFAAHHVLKHTVEYAAKKGMIAEELERRLQSELRSWQGLVGPSLPQTSTPGHTPKQHMRSSLRDLIR